MRASEHIDVRIVTDAILGHTMNAGRRPEKAATSGGFSQAISGNIWQTLLTYRSMLLPVLRGHSDPF